MPKGKAARHQFALRGAVMKEDLTPNIPLIVVADGNAIILFALLARSRPVLAASPAQVEPGPAWASGESGAGVR